MSRYFSRPRVIGAHNTPRAAWDDNVPMLPNISVPDHEPVDTGLLDARGDPIWRAPRPIGFGREWA